MTENSDLKSQALSSGNVDFYELLGVSIGANDAELRRAYRKTALKYHPDKVGPDPVAAEKFHSLQIAYDVLCDETARQLYDNARRAREEKKEREAAYEGRRRTLKEELERREREGVAGLKRKRDHTQEADEALQRELTRLAADGARRRKEREELLRRELQEQEELDRAARDNGKTTSDPLAGGTGVEGIDRTIKFRYRADTTSLDQDQLRQRFSRFGKVQDVVLKRKKIKLDGEKHRQDYVVAMVVFESIVGAHAAVMDRDASQDMSAFENVSWAGKEPGSISKSSRPVPTTAPQKAPAFTFKAPGDTASMANRGASNEERMMMRLREAERKRQERLASSEK